MYTPSYIKRENQFTSGGEYMLTRAPVLKGESDGYVGYYNITAEGPFTGKVFTATSKILFNIRYADTVQSSKYIELVTSKGKKTDLDYLDPIQLYITPTVEDIKRGFVLRYFIQQRNDINGRIKEIDKQQYDDLLKIGKGMNPSFYKGVVLRWKLSGPERDILKGEIISIPGVSDTNRRTLEQKERLMKGISSYLGNNLVQYSKYDPVSRDTQTDIKL